MKKFIMALFIIPLFSVLVNPINAQSGRDIIETHGNKKTLKLPKTEGNSSIIDLGKATDPKTGELAQGYALIHYKNETPKANSGGKISPSNSCYGYLFNGAKWTVAEPWIVNPLNNDGLLASDVYRIINNGVNKWEDATDGLIGNKKGVNIFGVGTTTNLELAADWTSMDDRNEVYFADIEDPNTIAVTVIWGVGDGLLRNRKLYEWDQIYDDNTWEWSADSLGVINKMDFDNIATHELGHSAGMGDLYDNTCINETMFGYAGNSEVNKRDLFGGDIFGINKLY